MSIFEWAVVAFIVLSILFHVWRGGNRNPVGTGKLQHDVRNVRSQMVALGGRVAHVEEKLDTLERDAATTKDIEKLEKLLDERIGTVRAEMRGHHELSQRTNHSVDRIERFLIERGLGGK